MRGDGRHVGRAAPLPDLRPSAAATRPRIRTPRNTFTRRGIRSSKPSSRASTGAGATSTKSSSNETSAARCIGPAGSDSMSTRCAVGHPPPRPGPSQTSWPRRCMRPLSDPCRCWCRLGSDVGEPAGCEGIDSPRVGPAIEGGPTLNGAAPRLTSCRASRHERGAARRRPLRSHGHSRFCAAARRATGCACYR
jgi:hypothetical protein